MVMCMVSIFLRHGLNFILVMQKFIFLTISWFRGAGVLSLSIHFHSDEPNNGQKTHSKRRRRGVKWQRRSSRKVGEAARVMSWFLVLIPTYS